MKRTVCGHHAANLKVAKFSDGLEPLPLVPGMKDSPTVDVCSDCRPELALAILHMVRAADHEITMDEAGLLGFTKEDIDALDSAPAEQEEEPTEDEPEDEPEGDTTEDEDQEDNGKRDYDQEAADIAAEIKDKATRKDKPKQDAPLSQAPEYSTIGNAAARKWVKVTGKPGQTVNKSGKKVPVHYVDGVAVGERGVIPAEVRAKHWAQDPNPMYLKD